ncbi:unnamed protein product [Calypogeia fissa]
MGSRSRLSVALLRSIVAHQQRFSSTTTSTKVPAAASASAAHRIQDEVNLARPEGVPREGADYQQLARKVQWGSAWLFAAAGLMAFSTTELGNALPTNGELEAKKTTEVNQSTKKSRVIFVLGGPGSGKGTQCARIVDNYGFLHLSAGDLLRAEIKSGSPNGNMIQAMIKEGKIVPSEVTVKLLEKAMNESENDKFLIDGFPRNEENRAAFENVTGIAPEFILFFDCPEEELERRLLGRNEGRVDDNIETIRKRFKVFLESSLPVIEYYDNIGKVRKINAARTKDEVFNTVEPLFKPFLSDDLLRTTERLLRGIDSNNYEVYKDICDPGLTAFEPEAAGHLVEGLDFHKFYFDKKAVSGPFLPSDSTIAAPKVTLLGDNAGLVTYTRLVRDQKTNETKSWNETRVWERRKVDGLYKWKNIHFHRSAA